MIKLENITKSYYLWWNKLQVLKWIDLEYE